MTETLEWTESVPKNKCEAKAYARETVALVQNVIRFKLVLTPERYKRHQAAMQYVVSRTYGENLKITEPCVRDNRHTYGVTALIRLLISDVSHHKAPDLGIIYVCGGVLLLAFSILVVRYSSSRYPSVQEKVE
ncbi:hypothetical protein [Pseudomonas sp.]|uniref:hypothetical protein n=1 Tax=Pseudomonas sp. TaxID=306 RepID=UPI0025CDB152|nr:hypothetical protein [Pseudomonas sp.]